jgi:E3 ubiquitin-protein ligase DOA10
MTNKKGGLEVELICRICLGEEEDPSHNPLFSPCKCAGSMGLIHLECIREWLKNKKIFRQGEVVSTYFWKNLECELCKEKLPVEI